MLQPLTVPGQIGRAGAPAASLVEKARRPKVGQNESKPAMAEEIAGALPTRPNRVTSNPAVSVNPPFYLPT